MPRRLPHFAAIVAVLVMTPLFFVDLGPWRRVFAPELHVFGHLLFFGILAYIVLRMPFLQRYSYTTRAIAVMLGGLVLGSMIELIQPYFGRQAGLQDVWQNVLGTGIAVALSAPSGIPRRVLCTGMAVVLFVELHSPVTSLWDRGVARIQFPVLSDFSTAFEHRRWSRGEPDNSISRNGRRSLRIDMRPALYTGTTMRRSLGNWEGYGILEIRLYNPDEPLLVTVTIRDHEHLDRGGAYVDRFNRQFLLRPGWNEITIPVTDVRNAPRERQQDLSDLAELAIFTSNLETERTLFLDQVRLQH